MTGSFRSLALALAVIAGSTALAQDGANFVESFSGEWFVFDPQYGAEGKTCAISLATDKHGDGRGAKAENCAQPLAALASWDIAAGQLRLFSDGAEMPVAVLGGNQLRITGTLAATGGGLIVERAQGDESTREMAQAISRHRCIYAGFTQNCADASDLEKPKLTQEGGTYGLIGLLVNLNVRDQPRASAPIIGTIPNGSCLKVNFCAAASDGIWCRAQFADRSGWIHKTAVRQNEWPVLTFTNDCP